MTKERTQSYSISMTKTFKDTQCAAFDGSITRTFAFLCELMEKSYERGDLDKNLIETVMGSHKKRGK